MMTHTTLRVGSRFYHRHWRDSALPLDELKRRTDDPTSYLLCEVTVIRLGQVYWRPIYRHGDREERGAAMKFAADRSADYVREILPFNTRKETV